jgi:hypothetical protein
VGTRKSGHDEHAWGFIPTDAPFDLAEWQFAAASAASAHDRLHTVVP